MFFLNPKTDFAFEIAIKYGLSSAELDARERREIFIEDDALIAERTSVPLETVRMLRRSAAEGSS